jgi:hypothetical protein
MNEPTQEITLEALLTPRISVDRSAGKIHVFFGNTPKAQISVGVDSPHSSELDEIRARFPEGFLEFQN